MKLFVCSVFDSKVGGFMPPIFVRSDGEALRAFRAQVQNPETDFHKFAEDYALFRLGTWEDTDGAFSPEASPVALVTAYVLKASIKEGN